MLPYPMVTSMSSHLCPLLSLQWQTWGWDSLGEWYLDLPSKRLIQKRWLEREILIDYMSHKAWTAVAMLKWLKWILCGFLVSQSQHQHAFASLGRALGSLTALPLVNYCWVPVPTERRSFAKNKSAVLGLTCLDMFRTHGTVQVRSHSLPLVILCVHYFVLWTEHSNAINLELICPLELAMCLQTCHIKFVLMLAGMCSAEVGLACVSLSPCHLTSKCAWVV